MKKCVFLFFFNNIKDKKALKNNENHIMNWGPQIKDPDDPFLPLNRSMIRLHPGSALSLTS